MQQHGSKYFAHRPPPPTPPAKVKNSTITEQCLAAYQIKGNHKCSNMVANILPTDPPPPPPAKVKNSTITEQCQMKGNHKCSNMVANILPADPPLIPWQGAHPSGKSQGNLIFLQGQGKVREFCKIVREIRKSAKVREF